MTNFEGCDVSVRVSQIGLLDRVWMLERVWDENISYTNTFESFFEEEINLSANNGAVISVKFLLTPNAEFDGLPTNPVVLDSRNYDLIFTNGFEID